MQRHTRTWVTASLSLSLLSSLIGCDPQGQHKAKGGEILLAESTDIQVSPGKHGSQPVNHEIVAVERVKPAGKPATTQSLTVHPRCPDDRWIAKSDTEIEKWSRVPLFNPVQPAGSSSQVRTQLEDALGAYGVYTWTGGAMQEDDIDAIANLPNAHRDCYVTLASTASPQPPAGVLEQMAGAFSNNIGMPTTSRRAQNPKPVKVTVAVIDDGTKRNNDERHGDVIASIIHVIAGPDATVELYPRRQLEGVMPATQAEVIRAIAQAQLLLDRNQPTHLIINLSIAWEPGENEEPLREALQIAKRNDVLVFAAAGNTDLGTCRRKGLPLPAGIRDLDGTTNLVHAVSAVDEAGQPLPTNRADTDLRALGRLAVVARAGTNYYDPMTGTSAATAVVSGIAAGLWARQPQSAAPAVIDSLGFLNPVTACRAWGETCPSGIVDPDPIINERITSPNASPSASTAPSTPPSLSRCPPIVANVVTPQPEDSPCKDCVLKPPTTTVNGTLSAQLAPNMPSPESIELIVRDAFGNEGKVFWSGVSLSSLRTTTFSYTSNDVVSPSSLGELSYAYVTMYFEDATGASWTDGNEIYIDN